MFSPMIAAMKAYPKLSSEVEKHKMKMACPPVEYYFLKNGHFHQQAEEGTEERINEEIQFVFYLGDEVKELCNWKTE